MPIEVIVRPRADHHLEPHNDGARLCERRHARLDGGNGDGIRLGQVIAIDHQAGHRACRYRSMVMRCERALGPPSPRCPLTDDAQ